MHGTKDRADFNMDHLSIESIRGYVSQSLSAADRVRIDEHVGTCPDCQDRLQDEIDLPDAMKSSSVAGVRRIVEQTRKSTPKR